MHLCALVISMYICSTMHCSLQWLYYSKAVDLNELPNGPGLVFSLTHLAPWIEATGDTFFCLNILIADVLFVSSLFPLLTYELTESMESMIQIWRCWVVWQKRWIVVILPVLWTMAGVGMSFSSYHWNCLITYTCNSISNGGSLHRGPSWAWNNSNRIHRDKKDEGLCGIQYGLLCAFCCHEFVNHISYRSEDRSRPKSSI